MNTNSPSLLRIIQNDYAAFIATIFPLITWLFVAYDRIFAQGTIIFVYFAGAATLVGLLVLLWRYRTITALFADGVPTSGVIVDVGFYRDRGRVSFAYTFRGQKYHSSSGVMSTRRTRELQPGMPVTLILDPENPRRAIIQDLYCD